jgi:DNA-binding LacI/PurR family transcriptional regulator
VSSRSSRPTIADVARAASVSITTVSDAMSGKGRVDPATRRRVRDAAAAVDWEPRRAAQALRSGRSGTIALCIPPDASSVPLWMRYSDYLQQLTASCAGAAIASGLRLLLAPRPETSAELARLDVDGLIVVDPSRDDALVELCTRANLPVVTVDRQPGDDGHWWVGNDHLAGAGIALDHLHARGARRVALLIGAEPWTWFDETRAAYERWCARTGCTPLIRSIDLDEVVESATAAVLELLDDTPRLDGVLALPMNSGIGVLIAATRAGVAVPDDLLVVAGVDSVALATARPSVTALDLQPDALASAAVSLLQQRIDGTGRDHVAGPVLVEVVLRERDSS